MNKEILEKVDDIINYIENSKDYQKYLLIKDKMQNDLEINNLLNEIKHLQKKLANNEGNMDLKKELSLKNEILKNIPLYREYLNTLDDLNNVFNIIETRINNHFDKIVN